MLPAAHLLKPLHHPPVPTGSGRAGNGGRELYTPGWERSHCFEHCYQLHGAGMGKMAAPVLQTSLTGGPGPQCSPLWQMTSPPGPADAWEMQHPINALTSFT